MIVRHLILDWSGTLVDDLEPVLKTTNQVLAAFGQGPLTREEFRRDFCLPLRKFYQRRLPGVPQETLERMFLERYAHCQSEIRLLEHTRGFLEFCTQRGLGVLVASTADARTCRQQMERFAIGQHIGKAYLGIVDKTEAIHHILAENRLERRQTLFVGDMEHDIEAGQAGGVFTCAVLTGYTHAERLRALQPDLVCAHLGELQRQLEDRECGDRETFPAAESHG